MDPSGNKNSKKDGETSDGQVERRLRLIRAAEGRSLRSRRSSRNNNSNNNNSGMPRPEEAPSSMGNNNSNNSSLRRRVNAADASAAVDPPAQESTLRFAAAAVRPNRSRSSDDNTEDDDGNGNDNPLLANLLRHLREYCRDGDRKGPHPSAINVEKARNVLEACAGNVALAGQLYWDDYFASQVHEEQQQPPPNPPPLDAPSAAEAEAPANNQEDEERRVRRRLESDFERLLPAQQEPDLEPEIRLPRRRRRRRRQDPVEAADAGIAAVNAGNIPIEDAPPVARPPPRRAQPPRQPDNNRAAVGVAEGVAAEASVSVSDDETGVAGVLRMVRATGRNVAVPRNRGRRRRRSSSFEDNSSELIRAREVLYAQFAAAEQDEGPAENERRKRYREAMKGTTGPGDGGGDSGGESDSSEDDKDDDDDAYLSENDWLFNKSSRNSTVSSESSSSSTAQPTQNLRTPLKILWGSLPDAEKTLPKKKSKDKDDNDDGVEKRSKSKRVKKESDEPNDGGEDSADDDNDSDADRGNAGSSKCPEIPSTWLHASFSPHSTAMGLALKPPKPEDVAEHSWRLQQLNPDASGTNHRRSNAIPLPYHCRGISAVLSIVTAMIYTGASIQSNQVTCSSSRIPFLELSEEDRRREFDNRMVDALSALIFIAAKASMERKKKALTKKVARKNRKKKRQKKRKNSVFGDDEDDLDEPDELQMSLQRRLKLCPVAWWKENPQGVLNFPADQWQSSLDDSSHNGPRIQLATSFSNLADIRAYVLSNMQAFCAPGGLALLLETIVGIHGEGAIRAMIERSRMADGSAKDAFLVKCTCEERQRKRLQDSSARRKLMNALDTTPPGHDCVSTELISLLLTGKIHSSLKGWGTEQLGLGILSRTPGEVGQALSRPEMPVWVLKGETCFSVLLLDHTNHGDNLDEDKNSIRPSAEDSSKNKKNKQFLFPSKPKAAPCMKMSLCSSTSRSRDRQEAQKFAKNDQPGSIVNLVHWNCWFGVRNLSGLRLITARPKWSPPSPSWVVAHYKAAPQAKHASSLSCVRKPVAQQLQERRASLANVVSADERDATGMVDEAAMERVRSNAEDMMFYPNQHRMWRFDMGERDGESDPNSKPRGDHWVPYYSLSREDQFVVEVKFGPQINRILWTRWPQATVSINDRWPGATADKLAPEGEKEPLPVV